MTNGITAVQASAEISGASQNSTHAASSKAASKEDSVQLSESAQQYLQSSENKAAQDRSLVEQLVQAAAAGDSGALSLLMVK